MNMYKLQLNLYRWILLTEYGIDVQAMYCVICHEQHGSAIVEQVPIWQEHIERIVEHESRVRNTRASNPTVEAPFEIAHLTNLSR